MAYNPIEREDLQALLYRSGQALDIAHPGRETGEGIYSLGGLTATLQYFANDTNIQISSAADTHTLTWVGVLAASRGGLGANLSVGGAIGDLLYANAPLTFARLAGQTSATKQFLSQTGTGSASAAPAWSGLVAGDIPSLDAAKITTGQLALARGGTNADLSATGGANQIVKQTSVGGALTVAALVAADIPSLDASKITSGALGIANGGTGQTARTAAFNALAPASSVKGDVLVNNGTDWIRLAVGANTQVLTADSTQASGVKWAAAAGGGGGAWSAITDPIANQTLSMGANLTAWTFGALAASPTSNQFSIVDTTANTNLGALVSINTAGTSTALPLKVTAQGTANGFKVDTAGIIQPIGTGGINATGLVSGTVADARLSANVPLINASNTFTGLINTFKGVAASRVYAVGTATGGNTFQTTTSITGSAAHIYEYQGLYNFFDAQTTGAMSGNANTACYNYANWSGAAAGSFAHLTGTFSTAVMQPAGAGTVTALDGVYGVSVQAGATSSVATWGRGVCGVLEVDSGTMASGAALYAKDAINLGGTMTTQYGLYVESPTMGATKWAIYTAGGNTQFAGATTLFGVGVAPAATLHSKYLDASTATVLEMQRTHRASSGTTATGVGLKETKYLTISTTDKAVAETEYSWLSGTAGASENIQEIHRLLIGGTSRQVLAISNSGPNFYRYATGQNTPQGSGTFVTTDTATTITSGLGAKLLFRVADLGGNTGAYTISGSSNTTPITITTTAAHGMVAGDQVTITGCTGSIAANGTWQVASAPTSTTLTLKNSVGTAGYTANSGTITRVDNVVLGGVAVPWDTANGRSDVNLIARKSAADTFAQTTLLSCKGAGDVIIGEQLALGSGVSFGFVHIPAVTSAGISVGAPVVYTGKAAMFFNQSTNTLYIHNGSAWVTTILT